MALDTFWTRIMMVWDLIDIGEKVPYRSDSLAVVSALFILAYRMRFGTVVALSTANLLVDTLASDNPCRIVGCLVAMRATKFDTCGKVIRYVDQFGPLAVTKLLHRKDVHQARGWTQA